MEHKPNSTRQDLKGQTILQVIPELDAGGAERTTQEVAQAIVAAGGRSIVVSQGGRLVAQIKAEGSTHVEWPVASKNPLTIWANRGRLIELIRQEQVSLIHARSRAPAWSAYWAAKATGIPYVTTYHGIYNAKTKLKVLYNSAMARGDRVIANSAFTAEAVRHTYEGASYFDTNHMVVIPRGADLNRFDPNTITAERRQAVAQAFGDSGEFRILLPGRLTEWKGQSVLIEAAGLLHQKNPEARFRVILVGSTQGRNEYEAHLRQLLEDFGVTTFVHLHDHWDDMPAAYDWADVTVSASTRPEAFGRVAVEAQAMGCPVIASAHGGALETVADGITGMLTPPGDAQALASALNDMMDMSQDARQRLGVAAQIRIRELFSTEAMTSATLSVYMSLTEKVGASRPRVG